MNYNFTDRVRKVLALAREEAIRLQHDYVGTEHILLGLIREGEGVAAAVLSNLAADLDELHRLAIASDTVTPIARIATSRPSINSSPCPISKGIGSGSKGTPKLLFRG